MLADALALADEDTPIWWSRWPPSPGPPASPSADLAPFYATDPGDAAALRDVAAEVADSLGDALLGPLRGQIEPQIADLDNAPGGGMAGSITAALFSSASSPRRRAIHFDIYG